MFRHCSRFIRSCEMRQKVFLSFTFHGGRGVGALLPLSGLWRLTGRQRFSKQWFKDILKPKTLDVKGRRCCLYIKINIHRETGKTVSSSLISLKWRHRLSRQAIIYPAYCLSPDGLLRPFNDRSSQEMCSNKKILINVSALLQSCVKWRLFAHAGLL